MISDILMLSTRCGKGNSKTGPHGTFTSHIVIGIPTSKSGHGEEKVFDTPSENLARVTGYKCNFD